MKARVFVSPKPTVLDPQGQAVANALTSVKRRADLVMDGPAGEGVRQLIDALLADDLHSLLSHAAHRKAG